MERTPLNDWMALLATATMAAFAGLIAGAIFAGEAGTFREWVSALSGWIAGIGAVWVGIFTIRPLVRQVELQQIVHKQEARKRLLTFKKESRHWAHFIREILDDLRTAQAKVDFRKHQSDDFLKCMSPVFYRPTRSIVHSHYVERYRNLEYIINYIIDYTISAAESGEFESEITLILRSLQDLQNHVRFICDASSPETAHLEPQTDDETGYWLEKLAWLATDPLHPPPRTINRNDLCNRISQLSRLIDIEVDRLR